MKTFEEHFMTLDEAIKHCKNKVFEQEVSGNIKCSLDHEQLSEWLKELKDIRTINKNDMFTIEEAIKDLGLSINYEEDNYDAGIANGFKQGVEWALKHQWISIPKLEE